MTSLPVLHQIQHEQADCLVACAAMVLEYCGISYQYSRLSRLLKTRKQGTVFGNLVLLRKLGVDVQVSESNDFDNISLITASIKDSNPLIVAVLTSELQTYWTERALHAVVVVGIDGPNVMINDPVFEKAPQIVPINEFLIAWGEQDYRYAILTKK